MIKDNAHAAQLQEDFEGKQEALSREIFAGEALQDWYALGFKDHEANSCLCYTHDEMTIYLYDYDDYARIEIYQSQRGPMNFYNVGLGFVADLIEVIEK